MNEELKITEATIAHVSLMRTPDLVESSLEHALNRTGLPLFRRSIVTLCAADPASLDQTGTIHVVQGNPIVEIGTGSLFQKSSSRFIITAAHIFKDWDSKGYEVRICVDDRPRPLAPGIDAIERDELLDIAVVRLTDDAAKCLHTRGHLFIDDDLIDCDDQLSEGRYLIAGHLAHLCNSSEDKQSFAVHNFNCWTRPTHRLSESGEEFGYLEYPSEPTFAPTSLGTVPAVPTVGGMSGANVWRLWQDGDDLEAEWDESSLRVVGVQVSESDDRTWLKCVLWRHVMPLIDRLTE